MLTREDDVDTHRLPHEGLDDLRDRPGIWAIDRGDSVLRGDRVAGCYGSRWR